MLWRAAATLAAPALPLWLARRAARGKEFPARLAERRGIAGLPRPPGRLLWLHAASVGETQSVLPLIARLHEARPDLAVLLTTATVTAARLIPGRLGERAAEPERSGRLPGRPWLMHQFAPLDVPSWIARFLDHWRPDAAGFVESELWPNAIAALRQRNTPAALVNARLSPRSFARWRFAPGLARGLLAGFALVLPQSAGDADRLARLGATVEPPGNLKLATPKLPADPAEQARLATLFGADPVWVAASTHPGEEALVLAAHRSALADIPGLRLILAPRHPERGAEVAEVAAAAGFAAPRRGAGADPAGELGERHDPETHLIPLALQAACGTGPALTVYGTDYPTPDGSCIRDFVHVSDLATAHALALDYLIAGGETCSLNLGTGTGYSVLRRVPHRRGPRRPGDPPVLVADPRRARDLLGWSARRSELTTLLQDAWRWEQKINGPARRDQAKDSA